MIENIKIHHSLNFNLFISHKICSPLTLSPFAFFHNSKSFSIGFSATDVYEDQKLREATLFLVSIP